MKWGYSFAHFAAEESNDGAIFEYFCDKNILPLLVDIVKAKPTISAKILTKRKNIPFTIIVM